jgi:hypothetical protein
MKGTPVLDSLVAEIEERLATKQKGVGFKHDASGTPIATGYFHGPGGLLSFPGVDQDVFHTIVGNKGIIGQLPAIPTLFTDPTYYTITGIQAGVGDQPTAECGDPPTGGLTKGCLTTAPLGRYEFATRELDLNRLSQRVDRADPTDLRIVGSPIDADGFWGTGPGDPALPSDFLVNALSKFLTERAVFAHRTLSQQLWVGSAANNVGAATQLNGFQVLVNTGFVDAITGTVCPSLDSDVKDFNYADVGANCAGLVTALTSMFHYLKSLSSRTGVDPVRWVFVMRESAFDQIVRCWPCSYLTSMCQVTNASGQRVNVDAGDQVAMRDAMMQGKFLLIDGAQIEVIIDDGIPENNSAHPNVGEGCFSSDIYIIPLSVLGGTAVTFMEYFQYQTPAVMDAFAKGVLGEVEGPWLTWPRQTNQCFVLNAKIEPRLILRAPWLAGRLQNVQYCPLQHERDPFPGQSYHVDGGKTSIPGPSYWGLWERGGGGTGSR